MKTASIKDLKDKLNFKSIKELQVLCLHLARFKKENKELLTYLLFESNDEEMYIQSIKSEIDVQFNEINTNSFYYIRKSIHKILSSVKKYIRYSKKKETEADLLMYFCYKLYKLKPSIKNSKQLLNVFNTQVRMLKNVIEKLHEDLQHDYQVILDKLQNNNIS